MGLRFRVSVRRLAALGLVLAVAVGIVAAPAQSKPKRVKPRSFEAEGTLLTANPITLRRIGVTRGDFQRNCAIPPTQGIDGYVIPVPEEFQSSESATYVTGTDAIGQPDLDMYYFDAECAEIGASATGRFSETGVMPAGTAFVLVSAFLGGSSEFTFEASQGAKG